MATFHLLLKDQIVISYLILSIKISLSFNTIIVTIKRHLQRYFFVTLATLKNNKAYS